MYIRNEQQRGGTTGYIMYREEVGPQVTSCINMYKYTATYVCRASPTNSVIYESIYMSADPTELLHPGLPGALRHSVNLRTPGYIAERACRKELC
jgi:hypothetical protein